MKEFRCADLIEGEKYHLICPIWNRPSESSVWFETQNSNRVYKIQYSNNDIEAWHPDIHLTKFVRIT